MQIDPKLRKIYDWSFNFPQFEGCGERFDGTEENIFCFSELFAQTVNWKELEKSYLKNKEKIDRMLKFEDGKTSDSGKNV
jgi:hypothetical protein